MNVLVLAALLTAPAPPFSMAADTLDLMDLQETAIALDPRLAQRALQRRATDLRRGAARTARLPQLQATGNASYQSEVTEIPLTQPGAEIPAPPKDRYEAALQADWMLWDGGRTGARTRLEEARYTMAMAELDARLHQVRTEVSESFFGALLLQERLRESEALLEDLGARLAEVRAQVAAGAGLPGDTALVRAELLGARQQVDELAAQHRSSLDVLGELTGQVVETEEVLSLPELAHRVAALAAPGGSTPGGDSILLHPRYEVFAAQRSGLEREEDAVRAERRPRLGAFGTLAYGSPGYAQFDDELHEYWRAGVQLQWQPWSWGSRRRQVEALEVQRRIVDTEEQAFTRQLRRAVRAPVRTMAQMRAALASDEDIIALREQVERQARAQFSERAIPVSRYTDLRTDLLEARVAHARHRVELARAQATYLLILGAELR